MAEKLRATRFSNGDPIPKPMMESDWWAPRPSLSWPGADSVKYAGTYDAPYNHYAVDDPRGICPEGWHVP